MTAFVSFERVFEVLDFESPIARPARAPSPSTSPAGRVEFDHVGVPLPDGRGVDHRQPRWRGGAPSGPVAGEPVLHDVSFTVRARAS